jgi:superfamily II DNA/RNA helicase
MQISGVLIGGENRAHEKARLRKGITLLVATPGRLADHLVSTAAFKTGVLRHCWDAAGREAGQMRCSCSSH